MRTFEGEFVLAVSGEVKTSLAKWARGARTAWTVGPLRVVTCLT